MDDRQLNKITSLLSTEGREQHVPDFELELAAPAAAPATPSAPGPLLVSGPPLPRMDHRENPRYLVGWRVAIVNKNSAANQTWYGRAYDISAGGVNIHSENNLHFSDSVVLLLAMPARVPGNPPRIVEVASESLYTILMANSPVFRIGFRFSDFKKDGKRNLEQYLTTVPRVTFSWGV